MASMTRHLRPGLRFPGRDREGVLDKINFPRFKKRLSTLCAYPSRNGVPSDMIAVPVQAERCLTPFHLPLAVNTFHLLTPSPKFFRPLSRVRQICRIYSQIFILRRTHDMHRPAALAWTQEQTAMSPGVARVIFDHYTSGRDNFNSTGLLMGEPRGRRPLLYTAQHGTLTFAHAMYILTYIRRVS